MKCDTLISTVRQIAEIINSGIQPVQNLSVLQAVGPERKMQWGHDAIHKGFILWAFRLELILLFFVFEMKQICQSTIMNLFSLPTGFVAIEDLLKEYSTGKYCIGDTVTIADICLVPQVYNASRFKVNMELFPNIARINATLEELPEFKKAHFTNQPDTPDELRKS